MWCSCLEHRRCRDPQSCTLRLWPFAPTCSSSTTLVFATVKERRLVVTEPAVQLRSWLPVDSVWASASPVKWNRPFWQTVPSPVTDWLTSFRLSILQWIFADFWFSVPCKLHVLSEHTHFKGKYGCHIKLVKGSGDENCAQQKSWWDWFRMLWGGHWCTQSTDKWTLMHTKY